MKSLYNRFFPNEHKYEKVPTADEKVPIAKPEKVPLTEQLNALEDGISQLEVNETQIQKLRHETMTSSLMDAPMIGPPVGYYQYNQFHVPQIHHVPQVIQPVIQPIIQQQPVQPIVIHAPTPNNDSSAALLSAKLDLLIEVMRNQQTQQQVVPQYIHVPQPVAAEPPAPPPPLPPKPPAPPSAPKPPAPPPAPKPPGPPPKPPGPPASKPPGPPPPPGGMDAVLYELRKKMVRVD